MYPACLCKSDYCGIRRVKIMMVMCAVVFLGSVIRVVQVSDYVAATEARVTELQRAREKDLAAIRDFWKASENAVDEALARIEKRCARVPWQFCSMLISNCFC